MTSRRGPKTVTLDELEVLSDRNMLLYFKHELWSIGHGSIVKQLPTSARRRLRRLGLIEDVGGLRLTERGLQALDELEA